MRPQTDNHDKTNGDNPRVAVLHRLVRGLQGLIFPPGKQSDAKGYGKTLQERYPGIPQDALSRIASQHNETVTVMLLAFVTGIIAGGAAALLKWGIATISRWLTSSFDGTTFNWWLIVLPVAGIILAEIYQRYILGRMIYHGEDRLRNDFARDRCYLPFSQTYGPLIASTLTLGFGGSAGSEGPIAYSGAAVGSNIGSFFRVSPSTVRILTAIGAGAGIAGIFKAPIGGALFTIEVIGFTMTSISVIALLIACVASSLTAYALSGFTPDIPFHNATAISLDHFPILLLFGIACGLYSAYYCGIMDMIGRWLGKIQKPLIKNCVAGLSIGLLLFLFPPLYGEGYGLVGDLLNGDWGGLDAGGLAHGASSTSAMLLLGAGGIVLVKAFATSATTNGGGVAGDFAPTIMVGSVVGFFFAFAINEIFGIHLPVSDYVFMGMAGVLAGTARAPLMAMFLITEMATLGYGQFLPIAVAATLSYLTVCLLRLIGRKTQSGSQSGGYTTPRPEEPQA